MEESATAGLRWPPQPAKFPSPPYSTPTAEPYPGRLTPRDQEVAAIQMASVPEPGALTMLASGCVLTSVAVAKRRRTQFEMYCSQHRTSRLRTDTQ